MKNIAYNLLKNICRIYTNYLKIISTQYAYLYTN